MANQNAKTERTNPQAKRCSKDEAAALRKNHVIRPVALRELPSKQLTVARSATEKANLANRLWPKWVFGFPFAGFTLPVVKVLRHQFRFVVSLRVADVFRPVTATHWPIRVLEK